MTASNLRQQLVRIAALALLALFLVPGLTWLSAHHFRTSTDASYLRAIEANIANAPDMTAADQAAAREFFRATPASSVCLGDDPVLAAYRNDVCAPYSELWQFVVVERIAFWTVVGGGLLLALLLLLGVLAFARREVQTLSFLFGWRVLVLASAASIVLQGLFALWLSFWLSAFFFGIYVPKLIAIVGLLVGFAILKAVVTIFRRARIDNAVQGELLPLDAAPALWGRVRDLAARMGTAPPAQIVTGIDANFFVTEQPLRVGGQETRGRALFVSIPLLRVLDQAEADAVLAHELGHFVGGDTASSAALGPRLLQYDFYSAHMRAGGITLIAAFLLDLYRVIFEIALQKDSREREFAADRLAAGATSADAIARSLVKVAAYSTYRNKVENGLFAHQEEHEGPLDIGRRVALGLNEFSRSGEFAEAMRAGEVPHPFDSHPPLRERIRAVGSGIDEGSFPDIVAAAPESSWADAIVDAAGIERRQWEAFERQFAQAHEESLAYRLEPANAEEAELVLRFFPPQRFPMKNGKVFEVNYAGVVLPDSGELVGWDRVKNLRYDDALGGADKLTIEHPEKGLLGAKSTSIALKIRNAEREPIKQALGRYWHRHQVMRAQVLPVPSPSPD
jgi:Zn-dependent protease with chaperone function